MGKVGISPAQPAFSIGHLGEFPERHAVGQRKGKKAHKRPHRGRVQQRAAQYMTVGVGAIEND